MAVLGFGDLRDTALPTLWDAAEIAKVRLQDGASFEEMVREAGAALQEFNGSLLTMAHYGLLFAVQDEPEMEYGIGTTAGFEEATEYSTPQPYRGATSGHTLPLKAYDRGLGWTFRYLKKARRAKLEADVRQVVTDARDVWQQKMLTRAFKMEGEMVGSTANASVPFADGGTTDSAYVPSDSPEGESFASSHDHYLRHAALNDANLAIALEHLQEHGHASPFDVCGARADAASWTALTGFKAPEWPGIVYHASTAERAGGVADVSDYYGYVETDYGIVRVWLSPRVPTNYYWLHRRYGAGDPRNPLRVRIDKAWGFGFNLVPGNWANSPVQMLVAYTEFGVGIGDRTNGVCVYIAGAGDYTTPTIS